MAEPGDHGSAPAAGRDRLRASHADREQVIEVIKDAFAQSRLARHELDARVVLLNFSLLLLPLALPVIRDRSDQARTDLRRDHSRPGRPHPRGRSARGPRAVRPAPDAV